jgi:hypothetical protein
MFELAIGFAAAFVGFAAAFVLTFLVTRWHLDRRDARELHRSLEESHLRQRAWVEEHKNSLEFPSFFSKLKWGRDV